MRHVTRPSAATSASGSPRTAITSAIRPASSVPIRSCQPSSSAASRVVGCGAGPCAPWYGSASRPRRCGGTRLFGNRW
jgi:hypothetical protein